VRQDLWFFSPENLAADERKWYTTVYTESCITSKRGSMAWPFLLNMIWQQWTKLNVKSMRKRCFQFIKEKPTAKNNTTTTHITAELLYSQSPRSSDSIP